jgi:hypothetical protein
MMHRHPLARAPEWVSAMPYVTVEGIVFGAWCEYKLPGPRGGQLARGAERLGMASVIDALTWDELIAWIHRRDYLAAELGVAFMPDVVLARTQFYERARERLALSHGHSLL